MQSQQDSAWRPTTELSHRQAQRGPQAPTTLATGANATSCLALAYEVMTSFGSFVQVSYQAAVYESTFYEHPAFVSIYKRI